MEQPIFTRFSPERSRSMSRYLLSKASAVSSIARPPGIETRYPDVSPSEQGSAGPRGHQENSRSSASVVESLRSGAVAGSKFKVQRFNSEPWFPTFKPFKSLNYPAASCRVSKVHSANDSDSVTPECFDRESRSGFAWIPA